MPSRLVASSTVASSTDIRRRQQLHLLTRFPAAHLGAPRAPLPASAWKRAWSMGSPRALARLVTATLTGDDGALVGAVVAERQPLFHHGARALGSISASAGVVSGSSTASPVFRA